MSQLEEGRTVGGLISVSIGRVKQQVHNMIHCLTLLPLYTRPLSDSLSSPCTTHLPLTYPPTGQPSPLPAPSPHWKENSFNLHGFTYIKLAKIKKYLGEGHIKSVIHAHVTHRLDQNNSLLVVLPKKSLSCLQTVQNSAARLNKRDHITPTLMKL